MGKPGSVSSFHEPPFVLICGFCRTEDDFTEVTELRGMRMDLEQGDKKGFFLTCPECSRKWAVLVISEDSEIFQELENEALKHEKP